MQQIQYIKTNQLHESSMNPRREFHQESIDDLANSIKQVGILQPIIARLNSSVSHKNTTVYEVICGARRLSAAVIANLDVVPVIVRDLTDEEAFDLMITENLQRKDISPLEEAFAFKTLIDKGAYDVDGLGLRFGKSPTYIRHRLKLNDLIPEFRELLEQEIIGFSHALEISKLDAKYQKEIFEEDFKERSVHWSCPSVRELKRDIERGFTLRLSDAPFALDDLTLDKAAGACTTCPKNTASNLLLFPDSPETGLCLDRSCFKHKSDIHFEKELKRIQDEEPDVIIGFQSLLYSKDEAKQVDDLKKSGVPLVEVSWNTGFERLYEPEPPEMPDREDFDDEEEFKDAISDYNSEVEEYQEDLMEFNKKIASGNYRKIYMAAGSERGKILYYEIRKGKGDRSDANGEQLASGQQIKELQDKDKRNAELAFEKTYNEAKELLSENGYSDIVDDLSATEWHAVYVVMLDYIGYVPLRDELTENKGYIDNKSKTDIASTLNGHQVNRLLRAFLLNRLSGNAPLYNISEAKALLHIAGEYFPEAFKEIELKHQGVYQKRKENIEKRINELKNQ